MLTADDLRAIAAEHAEVDRMHEGSETGEIPSLPNGTARRAHRHRGALLDLLCAVAKPDNRCDNSG